MSDRKREPLTDGQRASLVQAFCKAAHAWISTGAEMQPGISSNRQNTANRTAFATVMNAAVAAELVSRQELTTLFSIPAGEVDRGRRNLSVRVDTAIKDRFVIAMINKVDPVAPMALAA